MPVSATPQSTDPHRGISPQEQILKTLIVILWYALYQWIIRLLWKGETESRSSSSSQNHDITDGHWACKHTDIPNERPIGEQRRLFETKTAVDELKRNQQRIRDALQNVRRDLQMQAELLQAVFSEVTSEVRRSVAKPPRERKTHRRYPARQAV